MEFRRDFLLAVYAFAEGGEGAAFEDSLMNIQPTAEEMRWVLKTYNAPDEIQQAASSDITAFIAALAGLLDKIQTGAALATTIAPTNKPDSRGDAGMRTRKKRELGMEKRDDVGEQFERSAGQILYESLLQGGWRAFHAIAVSLDRDYNRESVFFQEILRLAREHGLDNGICQFPRGTRTYTMLSPAVIELCQQHPQPPKLLGMQPGERVMSLFMGKPIKQLITECEKQMTRNGVNLELALVKRESRSGQNPICLTPEFQSVLQEIGVIGTITENVNTMPRIYTVKIPKNETEMGKLAEETCRRLLEKVAKQGTQHPSANAGQIASAARPTDIEFDGLGLA